MHEKNGVFTPLIEELSAEPRGRRAGGLRCRRTLQSCCFMVVTSPRPHGMRGWVVILAIVTSDERMAPGRRGQDPNKKPGSELRGYGAAAWLRLAGLTLRLRQSVSMELWFGPWIPHRGSLAGN